MDIQKDLHLTLPIKLYDALAKEARRQKTRTAGLLRAAVDQYLRNLEQERKDREMAEYVERLSPASREFVEETGTHVTRKILKETEW